MPFVRITRRQGRPTDENRRLLDAVHAALVEGFKIPEADRHQMLIELDAPSFELTADRSPAFTRSPGGPSQRSARCFNRWRGASKQRA